MARFHIKENGEPGACTATVRECPRGGENEHYDTPDDARRAYEKVQEGTGWNPIRKASDEGARRGQVLLSNVDEEYRRQQAMREEDRIAATETGEDRGMTGRQVADYHAQAGIMAAHEAALDSDDPVRPTASNNDIYDDVQSKFAEAYRRYSDDQLTTRPSDAEIDRLASELDRWAEITDRPGTAEVLNTVRLQTADQLTSDSIAHAERIFDRFDRNVFAETNRSQINDEADVAVSALEAEKEQLSQAYRYYGESRAEGKRAHVSYQQAKIDRLIAEIRLVQVGNPGPRPAFFGRSDWETKAARHEAARRTVSEAQERESQAQRNWNIINETE